MCLEVSLRLDTNLVYTWVKGAIDMDENGKAKPKTTRSTQWDASNHHPTKAELEEDLSIPDATPEKLAKAVANYHLNKRA